MPIVTRPRAYTEPTTSADGSPITDLASTRVYYRVDGGGWILGASVAATNSEGGGAVNTSVDVSLPDSNTHPVDFVVRAVDLAGQEGADSGMVTEQLQAGEALTRPKTRVEVFRRR